MTPAPHRVRPRILTKEEVVSGPALDHWRQTYGALVPQLQARLPSEHPDEVLRLLAEYCGDLNACVEHYNSRRRWFGAHLPIEVNAKLEASLATGKFIFNHGHDRAGRPIVYYRIRYHEPRKYPPAITLLHTVYAYMHMMEDLRAQPGYDDISARGEATVVIDRSHGTLRNTDIEFLKCFYTTFKELFPGRLEVFIVYGINMVFKGLWAAVKPFLNTKSQGSTHLCGNKRELLEFIAEDQLADFLGGKLAYKGPPLNPSSSSPTASPAASPSKVSSPVVTDEAKESSSDDE